MKENISEMMALLKNEREGTHVEKNLEVPITSYNDNVSKDDPCIPPEVMTSNSKTSIMDSSLSVVKRTSEEVHSERKAHSISDPLTITNHTSSNLDIGDAAV